MREKGVKRHGSKTWRTAGLHVYMGTSKKSPHCFYNQKAEDWTYYCQHLNLLTTLKVLVIMQLGNSPGL